MARQDNRLRGKLLEPLKRSKEFRIVSGRQVGPSTIADEQGIPREEVGFRLGDIVEAQFACAVSRGVQDLKTRFRPQGNPVPLGRVFDVALKNGVQAVLVVGMHENRKFGVPLQ